MSDAGVDRGARFFAKDRASCENYLANGRRLRESREPLERVGSGVMPGYPFPFDRALLIVRSGSRRGEEGSRCRSSASRMCSRVSSHSTGSSKSGSANPAPAFRLRGLLR
jgi:hypothetical protein